jgi:hypothetical protein
MADSAHADESRADLLRRSREEHARLEALLAPLDEVQLARAGVTAGWSVKDHLAHLTWWERRVVLVLGGRPDPLEALPGAPRDEDAINAEVYTMSRDRPLADVRADFDASYRGMLRLIETVPDEVLAARYGWIDGNAASHYAEHAAMIEAWLARGGAGGA